MTVGDRLKCLRANLALRQNEVANNIGVSKQTLYKYENNIVTNIPKDKIDALAKILKTSPSYIMGWEDDLRLTNLERNIIEKYRTSDDVSKAIVLRALDLDCRTGD